MPFSRYVSLMAFAALLSLGTSDDVYDPNSICYSYGVDFVDEGHYFINSLSTEKFSSVSIFEGCNTGVADILLIEPNGVEHLCDDIPTTPEYTNQLSNCPIQKSQMSSGHWMLLILGNNGNGDPPAQPFAWQRDLYLDVGPQVISTYTPTLTVITTTIPITTETDTITYQLVTEVGPFTTVTIPSATAEKTKTITPKAVLTTSTKTQTKTKLIATRVSSTTTKTVTASCTLPGRPKRDKPIRYSPTRLHPAALAKPTVTPKPRYMRRSDRAVDYKWARARVEAAKERRNAARHHGLERRAPDNKTTTVVDPTPVTTTSTFTAEAITTTETEIITETTTSTLPPATVFSGVFTYTTTLPTPTKTRLKIKSATTTKMITWGATFTRHTTVTPQASKTACKKAGGHFG